jgi:hypothetical protein
MLGVGRCSLLAILLAICACLNQVTAQQDLSPSCPSALVDLGERRLLLVHFLVDSSSTQLARYSILSLTGADGEVGEWRDCSGGAVAGPLVADRINDRACSAHLRPIMTSSRCLASMLRSWDRDTAVSGMALGSGRSSLVMAAVQVPFSSCLASVNSGGMPKVCRCLNSCAMTVEH